MATAYEIWTPRTFHNHDINSAYRNDDQLLHDREVSDIFAITNSVKQRCVLAPLLFSILLSVDAFATASSKFDLKINFRKTEVIFQMNSTTAREEDINLDDITLKLCKN